MKPYLDLARDVLLHGDDREDRTGVGTRSLFGAQCRYDLRYGFPIVTTKRVNFSAVVKELLWFLRGETNIQTLGCGIWDEWADDDGALGPIYGAQWRRCLVSEDRGGNSPWHVDQVGDVVRELRSNPNSRRLLVNAWNVDALPHMRLPPCHVMWQLYACHSFLDLQFYQRSADIALGVPFNVASYALLLEFIAKAVGRTPRYLIHSIGDAHIYHNHIDGIERQLDRRARGLPGVIISKTPDFSSLSAWNIEPSNIALVGYDPHPAIKFEVAV